MGTHVSLGNHYEGFVQQMLESGRYNNTSEVLRDGLRMMEERERQLSMLDDLLASGRADAAAGSVTSAELVFDDLETEINALADAPSA